MINLFNEENFEAEVLGSSIPVFVDFFADWCGPCKMMSPVIDQLSEEYAGRVKVGKVDVDESSELAARYGVMSIPNMVLFKDGVPADRIIGAVPKSQLKALFDKYAG